MKTNVLAGLTALGLITTPLASNAGNGNAAWWAVGGLAAGVALGAAITHGSEGHVHYTAVAPPPPPPPRPFTVVHAPPPVVVVSARPHVAPPAPVVVYPHCGIVQPQAYHCPPPPTCAPRVVVHHAPHHRHSRPHGHFHVAVRR